VGIVVTPTSGLVTTEAGGQATFSVQLTSQPAADVTIGVLNLPTSPKAPRRRESDLYRHELGHGPNGDGDGRGRSAGDGDVAYTIVTAAATSSDAAYNGLNPADVTVSKHGNDVAGFVVSPTSGLVTTEPGGVATFTVQLTSQPSAGVTVGLASSDTTEGTVSPAEPGVHGGDLEHGPDGDRYRRQRWHD